MLVTIMLVSQCSPRAGRSLLTFFFDGVPGSDTTEIGLLEADTVLTDSLNPGVTGSLREEPLAIVHYPYQERECAACHDQQSLGNMVEPEPGLCYMCHEDFGATYEYLHGPVAGGYCTSCHDPHLSENEKLLRLTGEQLCLHCHNPESVFKNEMHQDLEGMTCTDCHNPHGGEDRFIFY
jgi:predicted CXXCH cytochrome family protein